MIRSIRRPEMKQKERASAGTCTHARGGGALCTVVVSTHVMLQATIRMMQTLVGGVARARACDTVGLCVAMSAYRMRGGWGGGGLAAAGANANST